MNNLIFMKRMSAVLLVGIGLIGLIFAPVTLRVATLVLIGFGIYTIIKKNINSGLLLLLFGTGLLIISKFLTGIIVFICIASIVIGTALFISYLINNV